ncbi:MAG: hypothetical protein QOH90_2134 [Actinomycetota bacterium]|nr:hypothetical protein [Actinomycetota bacterium]
MGRSRHLPAHGVNHEDDPERSSGIEGAKATAEWLRSCFGDISYSRSLIWRAVTTVGFVLPRSVNPTM